MADVDIDIRKPAELYEVLDLLLALSRKFETHSLKPFAKDASQLGIPKGAQVPEATHEAAFQDEETRRDPSWCAHKQPWTEHKFRSVTIISNVLFTFRSTVAGVKDALLTANDTYATWTGYGWQSNRPDALIALRARMEDITRHLREIIDDLQKTLRSVGCVNSCNGYNRPTTVVSPQQQPRHRKPQRSPAIRQSEAYQRANQSLDRAVRDFTETEIEIGWLHDSARLWWKAYDDFEDLSSASFGSELATAGPPQPAAAPGDVPVEVEPPLTKAPNELLMNIVLHAGRSDPKIPGVMGTVNRHFKALTNGNPWLWNTIHVLMPASEITRRIAKSNNLPLYLSLSLPPSRSLESGREKIDMCTQLFTTAQLDVLRSFSAVTTEPLWTAVGMDFLRNAVSTLPLLETVNIGLTNPYDGPLVIDAFPILGNILDLSVNWIQFPSHTLPPFPRLLRLKVEGCMTSSFPSLLVAISGMIALQCLSLVDIHDPNLPPSFWEEPAILPYLTSLELKRVGVVETRQLLEFLAPIRLTSVYIWPWGQTARDADETELRTILELYGGAISELHLVNAFIDRWDRLFISIPDLTHLHIASCPITDSDLEVLSRPIETRPCRRLAHISMDKTAAVSTTAIKKLVQLRHRSGTPVDSVLLQDWDADQITDANLRQIARLVKSFKVSTMDLQPVLNDQENSMGNTSSVDDSWSADLSAGDLDVIPTNWTEGDLGDRWRRLRFERRVPRNLHLPF